MSRTAFALALVATCQAASWPTISKFFPPPGFPWGETKSYKEGMQAWSDISTSSLVDIPEWMLNEDHAAWIPSGPIAEDTVIEITCPSDAEGDVCDIYVYVYYCPPCALHGGLPGQLLSSGWVAGSCAPHFMLAPGGERHGMAIFRKQIAKSATVSFTTKSEARFVGIGASPVGVDCSAATGQMDCVASASCAWSAAEAACKDNWCPKRFHSGVPPTCTECAAYDGSRAPATAAPSTQPPETSLPCKDNDDECSTDDECCSNNCVRSKDRPTISFEPSVVGVRAVPFAEGITAWADIPGSKFINVPAWMQKPGHVAFIPNQGIITGTVITFTCPQNITGDVCEVFVYTYHCPPCKQHGDLPKVLLADGWASASCAPHFVLQTDGHAHAMSVFRKQLSKGESTDMAPTSHARFVGFSASEHGVDCSLSSGDIMQCGGGFCARSGMDCVDKCSAFGGTADGSTANGGTANGGTANGSTANGSTANGSTANGGTANGSTANGSTANGGTAN
ncbi:protein kinase [Diplonema papillatum]|nr:protein kinase [Diplonema papillatum]